MPSAHPSFLLYWLSWFETVIILVLFSVSGCRVGLVFRAGSHCLASERASDRTQKNTDGYSPSVFRIVWLSRLHFTRHRNDNQVDKTKEKDAGDHDAISTKRKNIATCKG